MKIITRCKRCNRILTNDKARKIGMGKVCSRKYVLELQTDLIRNATLEDFNLLESEKNVKD